MENHYIERRRDAEDTISFDSLKRDGLKVVQELSGKMWTDYNLHDPGVTILVHLCYALTDLVYRTDFKVEDSLTDEDGILDCARLALHPPDIIFPCRPTTLTDYKTTILEAIVELENVWLCQGSGTTYRGLSRLAVRPRPDLGEASGDELRERVRLLYGRNRNLCEDVEDISIVREIECDLHAEIEVSGTRNRADILADIYYQCAQRVLSGVRWCPLQEGLQGGKSLEEMFRGPLSRHGAIRDDEPDDDGDETLLADLFSIVKDIDGVEQIISLSIVPVQEQGSTPLGYEWPKAVLRLRVPRDAGEVGEVKVTLIKNGRELSVSSREVVTGYKKLNFKHESLARPLQDPAAFCPRPQGVYRDLSVYTSIQNHFPRIYGINPYGVPNSAPPDVKAKAAQLKTYLLLFEQPMANYLAHLDHLRTLFSTDHSLKQSYGCQVLDNAIIPDIDAFYEEPPTDVLRRIVGKYDDSTDRKSRVLDYLLALHGETFTQESLRHFSYYSSSERAEEVLLENKLTFLRQIVEIGRDRAGAFDYNADSWNSYNVSGLQRKVSLLLGFRHQQSRSLTMPILKHGLKLISHEEYSRLQNGILDLKFITLQDIDEQPGAQFHRIPTTRRGERANSTILRRRIQDLLPLKHNLLSDALLRCGIDMDRYRLGSLTANENDQLVFRAEPAGPWWYLGTCATKTRGMRAANALRWFLIHLNIESEGFHLVEHILLRPEGRAAHEGLAFPNDYDFYSFRLSVIFPAWTARCHARQFQLLAEETVRVNCPAHIAPEFYWLDFDTMCRFELLYKNWLDAHTASRRDSEARNAAAKALIVFLLHHKRRDAKP
jgi:hypothetical protein